MGSHDENKPRRRCNAHGADGKAGCHIPLASTAGITASESTSCMLPPVEPLGDFTKTAEHRTSLALSEIDSATDDLLAWAKASPHVSEADWQLVCGVVDHIWDAAQELAREAVTANACE